MPSGPSEDDAVQPQWSALLAGLTLANTLPAAAQAVIGIETGSESVGVCTFAMTASRSSEGWGPTRM